jgi:Fanconi anemia group M protein
MMLVLPTAAGKTAVSWMVIADKLLEGNGWILMLAPTVALVNQHLKGMISILNEGFNPISITGQNPANKRSAMWASSRVIIATPQVVRNDIVKGLLSLSECSLAVFDEAHHSTGAHAMAQVGEMYNSQSEKPLILAMTASPGSRISQVEEICKCLKIQRIHLRTSEDPLLSSHLSNLEIQEIKVSVPEEIWNIVEPFKLWQRGIVDREKRLGKYIMPGEINHAGLSNAMERSHAAIQRGEKNAYTSVSQIAIAMRLHHLINHMLCQGIAASREFLTRMSEDNESKAVKNLMRDQRIQKLIKEISGRDEIHSKIGAVRRLVRERLRRDSESKIIIFATFRDTISVLEKALKDMKEARPIQFVGQSNRVGGSGLKPKEQIERLEKFRQGYANILLSTAVGEEGLDIPSADLVIFYEPVSSETRTIQRRGRTGRHREGEVIVLIAEGTRDEGARNSALKREVNMQKVVQRVKRSLLQIPHLDMSNMTNFEVNMGDDIVSAESFVHSIREENRPEVEDYDTTKLKGKNDVRKKSENIQFRSSKQKGLEDFK